MRLPLRWTRIRIKKLASKKAFEDAREKSERHGSGELRLRLAESNPEWVLLYNDARRGQFDPWELWFMKKEGFKVSGRTYIPSSWFNSAKV